MSAEDLNEDPVCKMKVTASKAAASLELNGKLYFFCNKSCFTKFKNNPSLYAPESGSNSAVSCCHHTGEHATKPSAGPKNLKSFYLSESALAYTCPMHPEISQTHPGSCPKCGMALEAAAPDSSDPDGQSELNDMVKRFWPALGLTLVLLGITAPEMLGLSESSPDGFMSNIQLFLALPVVTYCAAPIFKKALDSLRSGHLNMFTLIAFGVSVSVVASLIALINMNLSPMIKHHNMLYFESAASIVTLVLLGQILELKARQKSNTSLEQLFALAPSTARRIKESGEFEEISILEIQTGDKLSILPGDKIPADGSVFSGNTSVDESLLSGNSLPIRKERGDKVLAGTINGDGSIAIIANSLGRDTVFAQVLDLLSSAQKSRSPMQELADKVSAIFIPSVLVIAAITFVGWILAGGEGALAHAIKDTISVLVIACPCALGLATPIAVSVAVAKAAKMGLLVKDSRALEMLGQSTELLLDKTGTLTKGSFEIIGSTISPDIDANEALRLAASLEQESKHPLALSISQSGKQQGLALTKADEITSSPGLGISGMIDSKRISIGSARFMKDQAVDIDVLQTPHIPEDATASIVFLAIEQKLKAVFLLSDKLKPEAKDFIATLRALSVSPHILSGDGKQSVQGTGVALKIPEANLHFNMLPTDKVAKISELQNAGLKVAMLGDGINDAAALRAANAGIAMASGSDIALSSAGMTLVQNDLRTVISGIKLARMMSSKMKENLFLAFSYNAVALIFATGVFYKQTGLELEPSMAAAAMSLSSISVILNSMRLDKAKFD